MAEIRTFPTVFAAVDIPDMRSIHVAELLDGVMCWVESVENVYWLTTNFPGAVDGVNVVAPVPQAASGRASAKWVIGTTLFPGGGGATGDVNPTPNTLLLRDNTGSGRVTNIEVNANTGGAVAIGTGNNLISFAADSTVNVASQDTTNTLNLDANTTIVGNLTGVTPFALVAAGVGLNAGATPNFRGSVGTVAVGDATTEPTSNPATGEGGFLYEFQGRLINLGKGGVKTTVASATASGSTGTKIRHKWTATGQTVNAQTITLSDPDNIPLPGPRSGAIYTCRLTVSSAGGGASSATFQAGVISSAGTASIGAQSSPLIFGSGAFNAISCSFVPSGNTIQVSVTGVVGQTADFMVTVEWDAYAP